MYKRPNRHRSESAGKRRRNLRRQKKSKSILRKHIEGTELYKEMNERTKTAEKELSFVKTVAVNLKKAFDKTTRFNETVSPINKVNKGPLSNTKVTAEFDFLASKMPESNLLSSHVISFPSEERILGAGAFGKVKLAFFTKLDIPVAVKVDRIGQFIAMSEARIMARLAGHKCFPDVFGVLDNMLVMEFISYGDGPQANSLSMKDALNSRLFSESQWLQLCWSLGDALRFMHHCNLLHNDIKEDNILIKSLGSSFHPVICDFGKATHKLNPVIYNLDETKRVQYNSKYRHIAYELRNVKGSSQSEATDIYSLGRVFKYVGHRQGINCLLNIGLEMMCKNVDRRPDLKSVCESLMSFISTHKS